MGQQYWSVPLVSNIISMMIQGESQIPPFFSSCTFRKAPPLPPTPFSWSFQDCTCCFLKRNGKIKLRGVHTRKKRGVYTAPIFQNSKKKKKNTPFSTPSTLIKGIQGNPSVFKPEFFEARREEGGEISLILITFVMRIPLFRFCHFSGTLSYYIL